MVQWDYPFVTVGVVCKNEVEFIRQTLKSLINLNYPKDRYEIIVVDGDSVDGTFEVALETLMDSGVNYKVVRESEHGGKGLCFARNLVVRLSDERSKYIAFTDADCIVEPDWLKKLVLSVECAVDASVVGAGGPRYVALTDDKKELVINSLVTSFVATAGNPAFVPRNLKYVKSIPNYNCVYKKDILLTFPYDESLISDDNEVNFRIYKNGYRFLYVPEAKVFHHETNSLREFIKHMFFYGRSITMNAIKNRALVRVYIPLTVMLVLYLVSFPLLWAVWGNVVAVPLILYSLFVLAVFTEVLLRTRTLYSLLIIPLVPLQHLAYGVGVIHMSLKCLFGGCVNGK